MIHAQGLHNPVATPGERRHSTMLHRNVTSEIVALFTSSGLA
jgi:hypothetical protein